MSDREKIQRIVRAINMWHRMSFDTSDGYNNAVCALENIEWVLSA